MKAVALVESEEHVCVRYRLAAYRAALTVSGHTLDIVPFAKSLLGRIRQYQLAASFDAVVLQRTLLPGLELHFLRRNARKLIFDFDDAIWQRDSYQPNDISRKRARRFASIVTQADAVFAGNAFLASHAERIAKHSRVQVVPTCIEPDRYPIAKHQRSQGLTLVWVGSSSTLRSLEAIRPTLEAVGRAFPTLTLKLICDRFAGFNPLAVDLVPWSEGSEAAEIAAADIGLAAMPDDDWSRGKCGVKVLQYLAAGLPVIANPVGIHTTLVRENETGYLAATTAEWIAAIRQLHDPALRTRLGANGRRLVQDAYSVRTGVAVWIHTLEGQHLRAAC